MIVVWILLGLLFLAFWTLVGILFYMAIVRFDSAKKRRRDSSMPPSKPFAEEIRAWRGMVSLTKTRTRGDSVL